MWPTATDVTHSLGVCLSGTPMSCANMTTSTVSWFQVCIHEGPRNHVLHGLQMPHRMQHFFSWWHLAFPTRCGPVLWLARLAGHWYQNHLTHLPHSTDAAFAKLLWTFVFLRSLRVLRQRTLGKMGVGFYGRCPSCHPINHVSAPKNSYSTTINQITSSTRPHLAQLSLASFQGY